MKKRSSSDLLRYLQTKGPTPSSQIITHFGMSRPTLSRRVKELGHKLVSIGHARATRLAARHSESADSTPIYRVEENGQVTLMGQLTALQKGSEIQWLVQTEQPCPALCANESKDGLFTSWPWFLADLRPTGFLGHSFAQHMANQFQISNQPEEWSDLELLRALSSRGYNLQGNLILGDGRALTEFQNERIEVAEGQYQDASPDTYPMFAEFALKEGEEYASSAGGQQAKFTTLVCDTPEQTPRAVIVKFSPKLDTHAATRWADLLHAEHIANQVLRSAGFATAQTRIFQLENRVFLESERFDRVGATGRRGLVSLRALDAAYIGQKDKSWAKAARKLEAAMWISPEDCERIIRLHCFGQLIANTEMHFGDLSFFLPDEAPYPLAPVYDMLPALFQPNSAGKILENSFEAKLPLPEERSTWLEMMPIALNYWQQIATNTAISVEFKGIAREAIDALKQIQKLA